ncbi:MAG TPA: hypothetical protein VIY27_04375 [Myxococcota bacterium]
MTKRTKWTIERGDGQWEGWTLHQAHGGRCIVATRRVPGSATRRAVLSVRAWYNGREQNVRPSWGDRVASSKRMLSRMFRGERERRALARSASDPATLANVLSDE